MRRDYRDTKWFKGLDADIQERLNTLFEHDGGIIAREDFRGLLPARGPSGSDVNKVRGQILREFYQRGFSVKGSD